MKKVIILVLVNVFLANDFFAQDAKDLYDQSIDAINDGKVKKALSLVNKAIDQNPKDSKLYILKGEVVYRQNKDLNEFFTYLAKAISVEPKSPEPLMKRAFYYQEIGEMPNSILDYNDALKLNPHDSVKVLIYTFLGTAYNKIQKPKIAYETLLKGYEIDSTDLGVLNNLATCLDDLGRRDEGRNFLLRMIEIDSTAISAYTNLGFQASLNEEYASALKYLNKANELEPSEPYTLNNRGYVKLKLNDVDGAFNDISKSIEMNPNNSYAYRNLALVYIQKGDLEKACENLYSAKKKGFTIYYGNEVEELIKDKCIK